MSTVGANGRSPEQAEYIQKGYPFNPNTVHLVLMSYQFYLIAKFRFWNAYFAAKLGLGCEVI